VSIKGGMSIPVRGRRAGTVESGLERRGVRPVLKEPLGKEAPLCIGFSRLALVA